MEGFGVVGDAADEGADLLAVVVGDAEAVHVADETRSDVEGDGRADFGAEPAVENVDGHVQDLNECEDEDDVEEHAQMGRIGGGGVGRLGGRQDVIDEVLGEAGADQVEGDADDQEAHHGEGGGFVGKEKAEHASQDSAFVDAAGTGFANGIEHQAAGGAAAGVDVVVGLDDNRVAVGGAGACGRFW